MGKYKPRLPESIEALQNDGTINGVLNIVDWITREGGIIWPHSDPAYPETIIIQRDDGMIYAARVTDWIVKADQGKFFVIRNDDFSSLYKAVEPIWS